MQSQLLGATRTDTEDLPQAARGGATHVALVVWVQPGCSHGHITACAVHMGLVLTEKRMQPSCSQRGAPPCAMQVIEPSTASWEHGDFLHLVGLRWRLQYCLSSAGTLRQPSNLHSRSCERQRGDSTGAGSSAN